MRALRPALTQGGHSRGGSVERALSDLEILARDERLFGEQAFSERVAALEQLDYICEVLRYSGRGARRDLQPALALHDRLEVLNAAYCARLRQWLQTDSWSRAALRAELDRHTTYGRGMALHIEHEPLDRLIDGILGLDDTLAEPTLSDRDYVHLEDSPVRVLLDLVDHVTMGEDDCFVDLGSGLGRAVILIHWLTGVSTEGIEVQPAYYEHARSLAASFGLERVRFQRADASEADLSRGTVYYLFTPFKGRILRSVWQRLEQEALSRSITVCTYGAVSLSAAQEPWLRPASGAPPHEFALAIWRAG